MSLPLVIDDTPIRQFDGLFRLNDLHQAAGGEPKHEPTNWMRNDRTQSLVNEIEQSADLQTAIKVKNGGNNPGTYVCKELVYAYAMWVSARFHLHVIRAFDAIVTAIPQITAPSRAEQKLSAALCKARPEFGKARRYREMGLSVREIALLMEISQYAVRDLLNEMKECGLIEDKTASVGLALVPAEKQAIRRLHAEGLGTVEIARRIGRSRSAVGRFINHSDEAQS